MGVPKFFRWISERYPNLSVNIENNQIPVFDCLYLDMNGIIHVCSHPDDANVQFRITEEQIFNNVFKYIDFLFKTVKPKEVFFLAVDGVAPRAKMNQQRGRRFKSSKEAKDRDFAAIQSGVILPTEKRFDSNAITPGTEFMDRLQQALRAFIEDKIATDNLWHGVDVILSGHETPGEGEHKIQEYIRYKRSLPGYNPNTRHCLYGLDADLMLLGLASHEPYFSLLREEVTFTTKNKTKRAYIAEESKFFLLHLSLLRDYIDYEFSSLKSVLGDEYDLERIIDDWIVMSFLVGNDFVPHLPNLHIHTSALPLLWQTYIKIRPQMGGYINEHGQLHLKNMMTYIADLSSFDHKHFEDMCDDMKWMFGKTGERMAKELDELDRKCGSNINNIIDKDSDVLVDEKDLIDFEETEEEEAVAVDPLVEGVANELSLLDVEEHDNGDGMWQQQFHANKTQYYYNKLGLQSSDEMLANQAKEYFTAIQWISYYYFSGVPSWSWFYPQHYAPFVSDLVRLSEDIVNNGISFEIGTPFMPFEQLMAVLPADSAELLPDCYNILMTMETSPIIDFYPRTFRSDLNGKKREWEALVLIPFIEENRLLRALESKKHFLTEDEARRNVHSPHLKFRSSQRNVEIDPSVFRISRDQMVFGLCPNVQLDVIFHGFPTFRHVEHTFGHERAFVRVFENHSTLESVVLKITAAAVPPTAENIARTYIDKLVYVNWPAFILTKVVSVLDKGNRITLDPVSREPVVTPIEETEAKKFKEYVGSQPQELYKRRAVILDLTNMIMLETMHSEGHIYEIVSCHKAGCNVRLERNWIMNKKHWHLHQLSVLQESIDILKRVESKAITKLNQLFPVGEVVFCLDACYYGQSGRIQSINNTKGSILVKVDSLKEPDYSDIDLSDTGDEYMTASQASDYLDIDALLLSKITGSIFLNMSRSADNRGRHKNKERHSIGLDLKNNKLNLQVPGWVIKASGENGMSKWLYSMKVVKILDEYRERFPEVFEFIKKPNFESLSMEDVFEITGDMKTLECKYEELRKYLDSMEYRSVEKLSNEHELLTEFQISVLESFVDKIDDNSYSIRTETPTEVELNLKSLYRPHYSLQGTRPDVMAEYKLLDRVVCTTTGYTVPLGLRGAIIGIEPLPNYNTKLEVLFDQEFKCAISIRGSKARCYRMPPHALINTSYGVRQYKCPQRLVRKIPMKVVDKATHNSSTYHVPSTVRAYTKSAEYSLPILNQNLGSDILTALFSTASTELPPMPPKKYSETFTHKKSINVAISEHRADNVAISEHPKENIAISSSRKDNVAISSNRKDNVAISLNRKENIAVVASRKDNVAIFEHRKDNVDHKSPKKPVTNSSQSQKDFLKHCDMLFKSSMPDTAKVSVKRAFTDVIDITNCPPDYTALFEMCVMCGIKNATVVERHVESDVFMSFKCDLLDMLEVRETDLVRGRQSHVDRIWKHLYSVQQQRKQGPPNYQHHFVPAQFQENPFTALYPSKNLLDHSNGPAINHGHRKPPRRAKSDVTSNPGDLGHSGHTAADGPPKKFIKAPKSRVCIKFPQNP